MLRLASFISLFTLLANCGNEIPSSGGSSSFDASSYYTDLSTNVERLVERRSLGGDLVMGSTVLERRSEDGDTLCRSMTTISIITNTSYSCWRKTSNSSESTFNNIKSEEFRITYRDPMSGGAYYGSSISEKVTSNDALLCQKTAVLYPGAQASFDCYQKL